MPEWWMSFETRALKKLVQIPAAFGNIPGVYLIAP